MSRSCAPPRACPPRAQQSGPTHRSVCHGRLLRAAPRCPPRRSASRLASHSTSNCVKAVCNSAPACAGLHTAGCTPHCLCECHAALTQPCRAAPRATHVRHAPPALTLRKFACKICTQHLRSLCRRICPATAPQHPRLRLLAPCTAFTGSLPLFRCRDPEGRLEDAQHRKSAGGMRPAGRAPAPSPPRRNLGLSLLPADQPGFDREGEPWGRVAATAYPQAGRRASRTASNRPVTIPPVVQLLWPALSAEKHSRLLPV